jgi:hypothetical protein
MTYQSASPLRGTISIVTGYVQRPGERIDPPPGFRGKGVPFENRLGCVTRFFVLTR